MGVDVAILVKIKGDKPSDEQIARWSWEMCRSIGAEHFYLDEKDYNGEVRRALNLSKSFADDGEEENDLPVEDGKVYIQDGDPILAEEGEWLLEVSTWGRYYGVGYERGDLLTYCAIAEWVETNIPNSEVWYGGDSSGVVAEPFTEEVRKGLKAHLYSAHGKDYFSFMSSAMSVTHKYKPKEPCALCIPGEPRLFRYGWGKNYVAVSCGGCGKNFESSDNGETWTTAEID